MPEIASHDNKSHLVVFQHLVKGSLRESIAFCLQSLSQLLQNEHQIVSNNLFFAFPLRQQLIKHLLDQLISNPRIWHYVQQMASGVRKIKLHFAPADFLSHSLCETSQLYSQPRP